MHRRPAALLATTVLLAVPTLAACGDGGQGTAGEGGVSVVASMYPLAYLAERVGGEAVSVSTLTGPGQEPHDLELTVRQTAELADAELAITLTGLAPAVDEALAQNGPERVVDAAEVADRPAGASDHDHSEHTDEDADDPDEHTGYDGHDHGDADLHMWLDPHRMAEVAGMIEARLSEADPDNAATFAENLAALREDLTALDEEYRTGLAECEIDLVVVSHDAFGYLGEYGLEFASIAGLSPDAEPSPARLAELQDLVEADGVTTVFGETLASPALAETLAAGAGVGTGVLDPIEGLSDETAGEDYLSLMRSNLEALRSANGCR